MLSKIFPKLRNLKFIEILNKIFRSPYYIGFVAALVCLAEIFSFEFIAYYVLIVTSIIIPSLLLDDMTAAVPAAVMLHIAMSKKTFDEENTIVLGKNLPHFFIMMSLVVIFLFGRLIYDLITNKDRRKHYPRFLIGYGVLLLAYVLGGAFTKYYDIKTAAFGFREFLSISGFYFYFLYTIDWKKFNKEYFAWLFLLFGLAISIEVIVMLAQGAEDIRPGWGVRNDVGGTIAMTIGGAGYLAIKKKAYINWLFVLISFFLLTVTALTESRGGTAASLLMVVLCLVLVLVLTNWVKRLTASLLLVAYIVTMVMLFIFQREFFMKYFGRITDISFDSLDDYSSGRLSIWKIGLEHFSSNPIFGVGWYQCTWHYHAFPPRYHNTFIQLMGATGLLGLLGYLFHRFETCFVVFKKITLEKSFALICIAGLMVANLVDCHFFNIWLGFGYGFLLAFIEGQEIKRKSDLEVNIQKEQAA